MILRVFWAAFLLVLWQVLLSAQNPGLMTDDSGEIVAAAHTLGIGHSPGFPLYMLVSRLALLVPAGTPAFRLNLLAALFTLLSALVVTLLGRAWWREQFPEASSRAVLPVREGALLLSALSLVSFESVFAKGLSAKGGIDTLVLLGVSLALWAGSRGAGSRAAMLALFLFATGLTNHWPLLAPWALFLALRYAGEAKSWGGARLLAACALALTGLSVFLTLPLRAAHSPGLNWESPSQLSSFLSVLLRQSAPEAEFASKPWSQYAGNFGQYLRVMGGHGWPGFPLLAAVGAGWLLRERRGLAFAMLAGYLLMVAAVVRAAHFDTVSNYLMADYFATSQALPALLAASGVLAFFGRWGDSRPGILRVSLLVLLAIPVLWGTGVFVRQDKSRYTLAEDLGDNLLKELPRGAVVLLDSDVTVMPLLHAQIVEGKRPDVCVVPLGLLRSGWGFRQTMEAARERIATPPAVRGFEEAVRFIADPGRFRSGGVFYAYDP